VGEAVGVHVAHEQQLRVGPGRRSLQVGDDAAPGGLVAVDAADGEELSRRRGVADARERDRPPLDRVPYDLVAQRASASVVTTAS
jgi:hypothetical protein